MAETMKNLKALFSNSRTRTIILFTLAILLLAILVGLFSVRHRISGDGAQAAVTQAPGNIQSVPFDAPSKEYAKLQEQQNTQQAKQAESTGSSAIPTIIRASNTSADNNVIQPTGDVGMEFTSLNRLQTDGDGFVPKQLDLGNGKTAANCPTPNSLGTPVYDENGRLIGYLGADGKIRDLNGNVIGTVGADGIARDLNGKIIGRAGAFVPGTPVYDENGNLIGYVGADGKVRDLTGKVIGTLGPDGLVRDANGKVIGSLGKPVYDENGNLIGYVGPDGKVRDANGNIIGTMGPDGVVRDLNGNIIGKAGAIAPGTPVYDANGKLIGYLGPDGKVRDLNGNIIGTMGPDGLVRDANGNVIGSIKKPKTDVKAAKAPASNDISSVGASLGITAPQGDQQAQAMTDAANQAQTQQMEMINKQQLQQTIQSRQQAMSTQANQLLAAWSSPTQQYVNSDQSEQALTGGAGSASSNGAAGSSSAAAVGVPFIKAGTVFFATLNTEINSDEPGPVMATIVDGQYKGGKLLGTLTNQGKAVMLTFNVLTLANVSKSISINAVAIDQNTARTGLSTYTDNHYLLRYGSVFAAAFMQGYGNAFTQSGSSTSTNGLTTQTSTPDLSPSAKVFAALGSVGEQFSAQLGPILNTPPTVHVASGTAVGILFLADVQQPA